MKRILHTLVLMFLFSQCAFSQVDLLWHHQYSGSQLGQTEFKQSVADSSGNIYVLGYETGLADLNPDTGIVTTIPSQYWYFFAKYDSNGNLIFAKPVNYDLPDQVGAWHLKIDNSANIYFAIYNGYNVNDSICLDTNNINAKVYFPQWSSGIVKYDTNGNFIKIITYPADSNGSNVMNAEFDFDNKNNVYFYGFNNDLVDLDAGPGVHLIQGYGGFIMKTDSLLNFIDAIHFPGVIEFYGLQIDKNNNFVFWGCFSNSIDFDPGPGISGLNFPSPGLGGNFAPFILKLDSALNFIDVKAFLSYRVIINDLKTNYDNSLTILGNIKGGQDSIDLDPGAGIFNPTDSTGDNMSFLLKLDSSLNFDWCKTIGNSGYYINIGSKLNMLSDGSALIVGWTLDSVPHQNDFNFPYCNLKSYYGRNFFSKLDTNGNSKWFLPLNVSTTFFNEFVGLVNDSTLFISGYRDGDGILDLDFGPGIINVSSYWSTKSFMAKYKLQDISMCNISGNTFIDYNNDSVKQTTEPPLPNQVIKIMPGPVYVSTNSLGNYSTYLDTGNYIVSSPLPPTNFNPSVPVSYSANFPSANISNDTLNFAFNPFELTSDLKVDLTAVTSVIPGHLCLYNLTYSNMATNIMNGQVVMKFDTAFNFYSSSVVPDYANADSLVWNFSNLTPFISNDLNLVFHVDTSAQSGNYVTNLAKIFPVAGDITSFNNSDTAIDIITAGTLSNKIFVEPNRDFDITEIQNGVWLTYTIKFQNKSADTAYNVSIIDTLENDLMVQSIKIISASHPFNFELSKNRFALFSFPDINLPRKLVNETGSQGYIKFRVKVKKNLQVGDQITNRAAIYFDFGNPTLTSTVKNEVVNVVTGQNELPSIESEFIVFPNPVNDEIYIESTAAFNNANIELMDVTGKIVYKMHATVATESHSRIDASHLNSGVYFLHINMNQKDYYTKVVKL